MYDKVKKCLESVGYEFIEINVVESPNGLTVEKGFLVEKSRYGKVYIEIYDSGNITIWSYRDGTPLHVISKKEDYVKMFYLAWLLSN